MRLSITDGPSDSDLKRWRKTFSKNHQIRSHEIIHDCTWKKNWGKHKNQFKETKEKKTLNKSNYLSRKKSYNKRKDKTIKAIKAINP